MKKSTKNIFLLVLSLTMGLTACSAPTLEEINNQKLIDQIKDTSVTIPAFDRGSISGTVTYNLGTSNTQVATKIKVIRDEDIPKVDANGKALDINGKVITDPQKQTAAYVEKKGDVIGGTPKDITNGVFLISDLRPGKVSVIISLNNDQSQVAATVVAGKVTQIAPITLGTGVRQVIKTNLNISGKVVKPDGTPVANATVNDITDGFVSSSVQTNGQGEFTLPVGAFNAARNLEVSQGNLITSTSVSPEQTDPVSIVLATNTRVIKGSYTDLVNKKPVQGLQVKVSNTNISTVTDKDGNFTLRGVSLFPLTLEVGNLAGYINTQVNIPASDNQSTEYKIPPSTIRALGNLVVNLTAENYPDPINFDSNQYIPIPGSNVTTPFTTTADSVSAINLPCGANSYYVSNPFSYKEPIQGTIQIEGTDIVQPFTYPATPILEPKPKCPIPGSTDTTQTTEITVYASNYLFAVPINNLPSGEYTISVVLDHHETQKGIKVVVPSKDTIATELIQLHRVRRILTVGDVIGKVVFNDRNGNSISYPSGLTVKVVSLKGEVDLRNPDVREQAFATPAVSVDSNGNRVLNPYTSSDTTANTDGTFTLKDVPTGTRAIFAAVVNSDGTLNTNYLPSSYVSLNVVGNTNNTAPDLIINSR